MKILYIVPWSIPFEESNLQDIVNTQFGYYTLKNKSADITKEVGIDIHNKEFWKNSLKTIEEDIDKFIELSK